MNTVKLMLGDCISAAFSLFNRDDAGCSVLMYHAVGGEVAGDPYGVYSIAPDRFAAHVRCIADRFHDQVTTFSDGIATGHGLAITFDDGYRDNLTVAAPLLVESKLPFTVFVTPNFVTTGNSRYLSPPELKELASLPGASIGAHGRSHRRLTACSDTELADELASSRNWLEDILGKPVTTMSYPHGAVDARVRAAASRAGYMMAACSRFGLHHAGGDSLMVARNEIWAVDGLHRLASKAAGYWAWKGWRG
jgi:peptidoglycan/xylan/chitin deacetylase (PgdA/CDA1 family)